MTAIFKIFAVLGLISPYYRGVIISTLYVFFITLNNLSGYYSARIYKMFQGTDWVMCSILTSFAFPGFIF
jgi:transmembrane 9 superfamily protein 2/4